MNLELITASFIIGILAASVRLATPILLTALGEIFTERAGILNLGLEGIMLMGALSGFLGAFWTGSLWLGVLAAILTGALFGLLMGFMSVTVKANQVVAGLGITILGSGLSTLLFRLAFGLRTTPPTLDIFPAAPIPWLSDLPVVGPVFFQHNVLVYLALVLVPVASLVLFRTHFGIENIGRDGVFIQIFKKRPAQGGFAGAHLSRNFHKTVTLRQRIIQVCQRFFMAFTQKEIGRVGNQFKRLLAEAEKIFIHKFSFAATTAF